jgi:TetR/AcrR family transcriptional regulator, copper-responsive repressor
MDPKKRSRGRPATFDTERALDAATLLFLRHGYEGTSIAMLTEAMGVTPPTLYSAFGSKERLHVEALARYQRLQVSHTAVLYDAPTTTIEFVEKLLRASAAWFASAEGPKGCMIAIGSLRCGPDDQPVVDATRQARTFALERLTARIAQAKESGELPEGCDTEVLSRFVTAVVQGLAIQALDGADLKQLSAIVDVALAAWPAIKA